MKTEIGHASKQYSLTKEGIFEILQVKCTIIKSVQKF